MVAKALRISSFQPKAAFSLIEALIAMGVSIITLTGVMMMNSSALKLVLSMRQTNAATLALQERVEQFRIANWQQLTSPTYLRDTFFASRPSSAGPMTDLVETVVVSAYPDPAVTSPIIVIRHMDQPRILLSGGALNNQSLVRIDFRVDWGATSGRIRSRASSTILSKTGISRLNLAMSGGSAPTATPAPTGTPDPSGTPGPTATPTPSATPTPTPDENGNNGNGNGNGNGRGNVGGAPGKK